MENKKQSNSCKRKDIEEIAWIFELKEKVPQFLDKLKGKKQGFFHYSLSGDLYGEETHWGLGNTVFAVKIYYMLNHLEELSLDKKSELINFILSFQNKKGMIYDPLIRKKAFLMNILCGFKSLDLNNLFGKQTIKAETRQALSVLNLLDYKSKISYEDFPKTEKNIVKYLNKLDWTKPWGAGSHFSHLIFFLKNSSLRNKNELISFAIDFVNKLQNPKDGSWYKGKPNLQHRINGAMKIITGLKVVNAVNFKYPEKLIDLCLSAKHDDQACDNFNIIYVLKYANNITKRKYRFDEIKEFAKQRLMNYKRHYFPDLGGFSFLPDKANVYYYSAKITKGLKEPDIHGTVMFIWGISIIAQILGVDKELGFVEQIS